jgi:hypothetical protein
MTRRRLDPRRCNVAIDSCAIERNGTDHDLLVDRLLELVSAHVISLVLPKGVRHEILNPKTPAHKQEAVQLKPYTLTVGLNADEQRQHQIITRELQGNATTPGKHHADADHLFEAGKYGAGYFITHDTRILTRAGRLRDVLPPSLTVVASVDFLAIFDDYAARCPCPHTR